MTTTKRAPRKPARKSVRRTPESLVALQITDYLTAHQIRYVRNNVVRGRMVGGGYIDTGHKVGTADYTAYVPVPGKPGHFWLLHIETKAPKGGLTPEQRQWRDLVTGYDEYYIEAKNYEPVEDWLRVRGCL